MGKLRDLTKEGPFGRLTVLSRATVELVKGDRDTRARWLCQCSCGEQVIVKSSSLVRGLTKSCGCLRQETSRRIGQTVGFANYNKKRKKANAKDLGTREDKD